MSVITLTTEWQGYDYFNGVLKGKLLSTCKGATIIDNATGIPSFNLQHAAFVIRNTFRHYPKGSIHIICVQSEQNDKQPHLLIEAQGHYFIGSDSGIFHLLLNGAPERIIKLDGDKKDSSIDETDIFSFAASAIYNGKDLSEVGNEIKEIKEKVPFRATIEEDSISGSIIFIDSYGNAISNITRDLFNRVFSKKKFSISVRSSKNNITKISHSYISESVSDLLALFNSLGLLEIGINGANASELLSLQVGDVIRVAAPGSNKSPGMLF
jgi:S-adenosylmethionine hydrolase